MKTFTIKVKTLLDFEPCEISDENGLVPYRDEWERIKKKVDMFYMLHRDRGIANRNLTIQSAIGGGDGG